VIAANKAQIQEQAVKMGELQQTNAEQQLQLQQLQLQLAASASAAAAAAAVGATAAAVQPSMAAGTSLRHHT
jgi:hypothetical protein